MTSETAPDSTKAYENLLSDGWQHLPSHGFVALVGPFWWRIVDDKVEMAVQTDARHENQSGVVQGGMFATLADRAMGFTCRHLHPTVSQATIGLDTRYMAPAPIGSFLIAKCEVSKVTRNLAFTSATLYADDVLVATATAIFKRKPAKQ